MCTSGNLKSCNYHVKLLKAILMKNRKKLLCHSGRVKRVVGASPVKPSFITAETRGASSTMEKLGRTCDCFTAEVSKEFRVVRSLEADIYAIKLRIRSAVQMCYCLLLMS